MKSPAASNILAVDLGGTKVAVALFNREGKILARREEPTCQKGPQPGIEQLARLSSDLLVQNGLTPAEIAGAGIGIPAVLEPESDRVIWAPNLNGWRDVDLRSILEEKLQIPVFVEYDGHTAVLGEWWQGAGRGYNSIVMIIAGTGIGGGLILDGKLYRGRDRLAGAAGWFAMTTDADLNDLGLSLGHWESQAAGPGIARRAQDLLASHPESGLHRDLENGPLTAKQVFDQARDGDSLAKSVVYETASLLGLGTANIVSLVNPEIVILGGSVGRQGDLLLPRIREVVLRWAQPASARSVVIASSSLGADAGLYGAAYAAMLRLQPSIQTRKESSQG